MKRKTQTVGYLQNTFTADREQTTALDYRGLNHARMTEEMETRLRDMPVAFLALSRLRRLIGDGNTILLYGGVRGWATWLGCAWGYPKAILNRLAEEQFITVRYLEDGLAEVRVLPPRELSARRYPHVTTHTTEPTRDTPNTTTVRLAVTEADPTRSTSDPTRSTSDPTNIPASRSRGRADTAQSRIPERSTSDRMSHDHESDQLASQLVVQQKTQTQPDANSDVQTDIQTMTNSEVSGWHEASPTESFSPTQQAVLQGLLARKIYPSLANRILTRHPTLTLAEFDLQVARLTARGRYHAPVFVAAKILARGELIADVEPAPAVDPPQKPRPSDTIRFAGHITEEVRQKWLDLCAQHPAHTAQIVQEFLARYPVPVQVEAA